LAELAVRFGVKLPFAEAAMLLTAACGTVVAHDTVRRLTEAAGTVWRQLDLDVVTALATAAHTPFADPVVVPETQPLDPTRPVILELDGAMVPLVHGEWAEARTLVIGTQDGNTTTALSYVSQLAPAATFARTILPDLTRRGVDAHPGPVVALSDGAVWIQDLLDLHCPRAVRVLDVMHAAGYLAQAAQASFGPGTATTSEWFATTRGALRRGNTEEVLTSLAALPASPERDTALHYLGSRRAMLAYDRCDAEGWPVGSGAVESANKVVVEARLKGAGMHWTREHADALIGLRALDASDRWTAAWPRIVAGLRARQPRAAVRRRIARPPPAPPAAVPMPAPPPASPPPREPSPPRVPTIVNGKPTADHAWRRHTIGRQRPFSAESQ
jgi:hypothetical protein